MSDATPSLRIAVADDEPTVREYFATVLRGMGHDVVVIAADGHELVDGCREERPDLIITDIRMDGFSGIEAIREIAKDGPIASILISAHYRAEDLRGELDGDVLAFLPKPVKLATLQAAVAEAADKLS